MLRDALPMAGRLFAGHPGRRESDEMNCHPGGFECPRSVHCSLADDSVFGAPMRKSKLFLWSKLFSVAFIYRWHSEACSANERTLVLFSPVPNEVLGYNPNLSWAGLLSKWHAGSTSDFSLVRFVCQSQHDSITLLLRTHKQNRSAAIVGNTIRLQKIQRRLEMSLSSYRRQTMVAP